jgi:hypothetical protein
MAKWYLACQIRVNAIAFCGKVAPPGSVLRVEWRAATKDFAVSMGICGRARGRPGIIGKGSFRPNLARISLAAFVITPIMRIDLGYWSCRLPMAATH